MAPNPRVASAFRAMRSLGIIEEKTKPVLKNLLKLYDKNWELIEDENYRVLADAIFEYEESEAVDNEKKTQDIEKEEGLEEEAQVDEEPERPLKRLRLRQQESQVSPLSNSNPELGETSLKKPTVEDERPETCPEVGTDSPRSNMEITIGDSHPFSVQPLIRNKGKQPVSPKPLEVQEISEPSHPDATGRDESNSISSPIRRKDKGKEILSLSPPVTPREKRPMSERLPGPLRLREVNIEPGIILLPKPKIPTTNSVIEAKDAPITDEMLQCEVPIAVIHPEPLCKEKSSIENGLIRELDGPETLASQTIDIEDRGDGAQASSKAEVTNCDMASIPDESAIDMVIDSLPSCGEERINATPAADLPERSNSLDSSLNGSVDKRSAAKSAVPKSLILPSSSNGSDNCLQSDEHITVNCSELDKGKEQNCIEDTISRSSTVVPRHQLSPDEIRSLHNVNDIAKGQERVVISYVNEVNAEGPPSFHYIPRNVVYQSAYVNFSLARIGDNRCCPTCFGDCLSSSTPCACARETGGDFAYTVEGLVKEDLLKECISMNRDPEKHCHFYCEECPLERSKTEDTLEPCKGHLVRKFIKECWWKCGCNKQCGNRVVQRGINRKLQVFMTGEGKGWGLRTLEDLPKGAFVCEYVGEVLTNSELYERVSKSTSTEEHTYPVLLDADWGSEGVLKDEESLCLDATYYGNVARFINHRCFDSNMVEIPVEVETPDHHYYHLAFFTTRKVSALEELTWDYGIDFDDDNHPVKAFQCHCGSKFCRTIKSSSTTPTKSKKSASSPATSKTKQTTSSEGIRQGSNCLPQYRSNISAMEKIMETVQLKKSHKTALQKTPFWDFFEAFISNRVHPSNCKKSDKLIVEIIEAYSPEHKAFQLGGKMVHLGPTDFSLILGISSGKNPMSLSYGKKPNTSFTTRRFPNTKRLTAPLIKDKLMDALKGNKKNDIEDVARLLCLYFCLNLLFTTRGNSIGWAFIHYVENLDDMKNYAWSETICDLLMSSIEKSYHSPGQVIGCVGVLPFWLCEHTTIIQPLDQTLRPRFLKWDLGELQNVLNIRGLNSLTKPEVLEGELKKIEQEETLLAIEEVEEEEEEEEKEEAIKRTRSQMLSGAKSKTPRR